MGLDDRNDADLVAAVRAGEQEAFRELVTRYQGHVYGLAYSLVGDWAEAQDIAQETFIRAYSNLDQLREAAKFAAWLRRVAFVVTMNWLRAFRPGLFRQLDGRVDLDNLGVPDFRPGPAEAAERRELAEAVLRAVASLPPRYRVPLTMFHLDGLSYKKVAAFLDIPLGTAQGLIHRAREKLKAALSAATAGEVLPMVKEVFDEHKLPEEFASKVLEKVPALGWGRGKDCTFAGALEAAMAATEHPFSYTDLMGFTALGFRTRWYKGPKPLPWCPSSAVGEMEEEITAAARATGWPLKVEVHFDETERAGAAAGIIESINAGRAVPAYDTDMDMAVVYGYSEGGRRLLVRNYHKGEQPLDLEAGKIGWLWLILGEHTQEVSTEQAVVEALKMAARNWRREVGHEGPGDYWYGPAAYRAWTDLLARADELETKDRSGLMHCNWFSHATLLDARRAAAAFLAEHAARFPAPARGALERAADGYRQLLEAANSPDLREPNGFFHPLSADALARWTASVRRREIAFLRQAADLDEAAIAQIETALAAIG